MFDRETILPLAVGAVVALATHAVVLALAGRTVQRAEQPVVLQVGHVSAPSEALAGDDIEVTWTVTNVSERATPFPWTDGVYLSPDDTWSPDDRPIAYRASDTRLAPGDAATVTHTVTLPPRARGEQFLIVKVDAYDQLPADGTVEDDRRVAHHAIALTLPPRPDLAVTRVEADDPSEVSDVIALLYSVSTDGEPLSDGATWEDHVLVSRDDQPGFDDALVARFDRRADESHTGHLVDLTLDSIPVRYSGDVYLIVRADGLNAIDEYPNEDNNAMAVPINLPERQPRKPQPDDTPRKVDAQAEQRPKPQPKKDVPLGADDVPETTTVSWIAHEDFEKLIAPKSKVEQAPLQRMVDPAPVERMPDNPTPPVPPSPKASIARSATQVTVPSVDPEPARQIESESIVKTPNPPIRRPPAESVARQAVPATQLAKADAPDKVDNARPTDQTAATTDQPSPDGRPTTQQATAAPPVALPDPDIAGPDVIATDAPLALRTRPESIADLERDTPPTQQPAARTDDPAPDGVPTKQVETKTPVERDDGGATQQLPARTPDPQPDGKPATAKPIPSPAPPKPEARDVNQPTDKKPTPTDKAEQSSQARPEARDANPTAAPRSDKEVPPSSLKGAEQVKPGRVVTTRGIEIKTIRPDFSVVTLVSAFPRNPIAKLTFNGEGKVVRAELTRTTGYADLDSPILVSLYQWRASGKELKKYPDGFTVTMGLLLVN